MGGGVAAAGAAAGAARVAVGAEVVGGDVVVGAGAALGSGTTTVVVVTGAGAVVVGARRTAAAAAGDGSDVSVVAVCDEAPVTERSATGAAVDGSEGSAHQHQGKGEQRKEPETQQPLPAQAARTFREGDLGNRASSAHETATLRRSVTQPQQVRPDHLRP